MINIKNIILKAFLSVTALSFILIFLLTDSYTFNASDNKSCYGDGVSANWADIKPYLSAVYKNTPYISISNGKNTQKFYFNVEIFYDLGLCVYGEPNSVQFTGTVNDFKAVKGGYFNTIANGISTQGEYRFLGFSLNGTPITNSRFPSEVEINASSAGLVKYTDLPQNVKKLFGVNNLSNASYLPIKDLIESSDSPIWSFTTTVNGKQESLRDRLTKMGLFKNGKASVSLSEYGIIYSWAESGGVIRLFFASDIGTEFFYSYATFAGPVSIDFVKKYPLLSSFLYIEDNPDFQVGKNTFYLGPTQESLLLNVSLHGAMTDNHKKLSDFMRMYSFTRDQMTDYSIIIDNSLTNNSKKSAFDNHVDFDGTLFNYKINASELSAGRNTIHINGVLKIRFGNSPNIRYISAPCSLDICVIYEPYIAATATPIPAATPTASPEPSESIPSENTPRVEICRRW